VGLLVALQLRLLLLRLLFSVVQRLWRYFVVLDWRGREARKEESKETAEQGMQLAIADA
jgi:hypothetical protein